MIYKCFLIYMRIEGYTFKCDQIIFYLMAFQNHDAELQILKYDLLLRMYIICLTNNEIFVSILKFSNTKILILIFNRIC